MQEEEDPCETCLFKIRCKELCEKGVKYYKKQMLLSFDEVSLRHFKLDALLLVTPMKAEQFLLEYSSLEKEIDNIRDGNELIERMNLLRRKRDGSERTEKRNKNKKTMRLNLFTRKNNGEKNLFKNFLSRTKEVIKGRKQNE